MAHKKEEMKVTTEQQQLIKNLLQRCGKAEIKGAFFENYRVLPSLLFFISKNQFCFFLHKNLDQICINVNTLYYLVHFL